MSPPRIPVDVDRLVRLTDLPSERVHELVSNSRTRVALHVVSASDPPSSLETLATAVARLNDRRSRAAARVSLVHVTLPRLEDYGVIEYELRSGTVHLEGPVVALEDPIGAEQTANGGGDPIGSDRFHNRP